MSEQSVSHALDAPMRGVDAAWLHMDEPTNLMVVSALLMLDRMPEPARLRAAIEARLVCFRRFRMRVGHNLLGRPRWVGDERFDLDRHLQYAAIDGDLLEEAARLTSRPLPPDRPLWAIHVLSDRAGRVATLARFHHCIADGVAILRVLLRLADAPPGPAPSAERALAISFGGVCSLLRSGLEVARLVLVGREPRSGLKGPLGLEKRLAVSRPFPLETVKAAAHRRSCTVNDLLMDVLTAALRTCIRERGVPLGGDEVVHAVVPVDLRNCRDQDLGNRFGLAFMPLPIGLRDRLGAIRVSAARLKRSSQPWVLYALLGLFGSLPRWVERPIVSLFGARATLVVTNLAGPRQRLAIAGAEIEQMMFWVPQAGRLGLGVSLLSYAGEIRVGVASDATLVPDPSRLVLALEAALEEDYGVRPTRPEADQRSKRSP
jgi:hypothetical protein